MENWNWKRIGIGLGIGALMMLHPLGRKIILFLLPLGKGWDDFVAIFLIIAFLIWLGATSWTRWNKMKSMRAVNAYPNTRLKQAVLATLCIIAFFVYPTTGRAIGNAILFSKSSELSSPEFIIPTAIIAIVIVAGWNIISYIDKRNFKQ